MLPGHAAQGTLVMGQAAPGSTVMVDGQAVQFLWANFYNKVGAEFASACKVMPQKARWRSCRCIEDSSGFMKKLIADCGVFQGQWVRITFHGPREGLNEEIEEEFIE